MSLDAQALARLCACRVRASSHANITLRVVAHELVDERNAP